jgi:hypothetical protein
MNLDERQEEMRERHRRKCAKYPRLIALGPYPPIIGMRAWRRRLNVGNAGMRHNRLRISGPVGVSKPISDASQTLGTARRALPITGQFLLDHSGYFVYLWERDGFALYVGQSGKVLGRVGNHGILGVIEPIQPTDNILLYQCDSAESAVILERKLIFQLRPTYNSAVITPME